MSTYQSEILQSQSSIPKKAQIDFNADPSIKESFGSVGAYEMFLESVARSGLHVGQNADIRSVSETVSKGNQDIADPAKIKNLTTGDFILKTRSEFKYNPVVRAHFSSVSAYQAALSAWAGVSFN